MVGKFTEQAEQRKKPSAMGNTIGKLHEALKNVRFDELEGELKKYKRARILALIESIEVTDAVSISDNPGWDHNVGQRLTFKFKTGTLPKDQDNKPGPLGITRDEAKEIMDECVRSAAEKVPEVSLHSTDIHQAHDKDELSCSLRNVDWHFHGGGDGYRSKESYKGQARSGSDGSCFKSAAIDEVKPHAEQIADKLKQDIALAKQTVESPLGYC